MLSIYCLAYFENWRTKVCSNYFYKIINIFFTILLMLMYCACNVGPGICRVSSRAGEPKPQGTTWEKKQDRRSRLENCQEPKPHKKNYPAPQPWTFINLHLFCFLRYTYYMYLCVYLF